METLKLFQSQAAWHGSYYTRSPKHISDQLKSIRNKAPSLAVLCFPVPAILPYWYMKEVIAAIFKHFGCHVFERTVIFLSGGDLGSGQRRDSNDDARKLTKHIQRCLEANADKQSVNANVRHVPILPACSLAGGLGSRDGVSRDASSLLTNSFAHCSKDARLPFVSIHKRNVRVPGKCTGTKSEVLQEIACTLFGDPGGRRGRQPGSKPPLFESTARHSGIKISLVVDEAACRCFLVGISTWFSQLAMGFDLSKRGPGNSGVFFQVSTSD